MSKGKYENEDQKAARNTNPLNFSNHWTCKSLDGGMGDLQEASPIAG